MKKVLVYCGIHNCDSLRGMMKGYDVVYGFDANPEKVENAKNIFKGKDNVNIEWGALCNENEGTIDFNITLGWDASSSIGLFNPLDPHIEDPKSPLYHVKVKTISVPCINLKCFLESKDVSHIDFLVTDLQGMDLTVLQTMREWIDSRKIYKIQSETEKDEFPEIYQGLSNNKLKDFKLFLDNNYEMTEFITQRDWWEGDTTWTLKKNSLSYISINR